MRSKAETALGGRWPGREHVLAVFAVSALISYGWTILALFRSLTVNWMLFMRTAEVVGVAAYLLLSAFIESVLLVGMLIVLAGLLPTRLLAAHFTPRASVLAASLLGSMAVYMQAFEITELAANAAMWLLGWTVAAAALLLTTARSARFSAAVTAFADRCVVLLYLLLPLTAVALVIVLIGNLA